MNASAEPGRPVDPTSPSGLVEHYFRHEYGRLVAVLVRRVGFSNLEVVEDAVQGALLAALATWLSTGIPDDPGAWLYRVAHNRLVGALRKDQGHQRILDGAAGQSADDGEEPVAPTFAGEVRDELAELYAVLERIDPSPIHTLNRAVAAAEAQGPEAGLALMRGVVPPEWLDGHYLWDAVLADLCRRSGAAEAADRHRERALAAAPSAAVRRLLERRLSGPTG